jgi:hypothetical protein
MIEATRLLSQFTDSNDGDDNIGTTLRQKECRHHRLFSLKEVIYITACLLLFLILGITLGSIIAVNILKYQDVVIQEASTSSCKQLRFRREWRSLSKEEKKSYLDSVVCLHERPSRLGLNQSLYHDFAWVHYRIGGVCKLNSLPEIQIDFF